MHENFGHREHVQLAFAAVRAHGMPEAVEHVCAAIKQMAAYNRVPAKYHHTVSRAWVEIVAHHGAADAADFDQFIGNNPRLLDKRLLSSHYSNAALSAVAARNGWMEPDLEPFPWRGSQH
jgi:hypothetical protein